MKILLCAINSKFSHTNLAVRLINRYSGERADILEFTINENTSYIISEIFKYSPDVVCFSAYIWNIEIITRCAEVLRKVLPKVKIIVGGPEVSYDAEEYLTAHSFIDGVMAGEGEASFLSLINSDFDFSRAFGIVYRDGENIITTPPAVSVSLDELSFAYTDSELLKYKNKLLYYESSRGCPYNCSYCLSSTLHSVRFKSLENVKKDLTKFIDSNVRIVKFIDRTFNADIERAYEIFNFLIQEKQTKSFDTCFHFEISAHILNDKVTELLAAAPKGLFQFEIGVQSTNKATISAIDRKTDFTILSENVKKLSAPKNIHLHLDLIAGLPYEDYDTFKKSFCDVFALRPDMLQLGFLKLLKGTKIRREQDIHGYTYLPYPPYEFLENKYLSYSETLKLKAVEDMVDKLYNSSKFSNTIDALLKHFSSSFDMFYELSRFFEEKEYNRISLSQGTLYSFMVEFCSRFNDTFLTECIKLDYYSLSHANTLPPWDAEFSAVKNRFEIIEENRNTLFSEFGTTPAKEIVKQVQFARFRYDIKTKQKADYIYVIKKDGSYRIKKAEN